MSIDLLKDIEDEKFSLDVDNSADPDEVVCPCGGPPCSIYGYGCYAQTRREWDADLEKKKAMNDDTAEAIILTYTYACFDHHSALRRGDEEARVKYRAVADSLQDAYPTVINGYLMKMNGNNE